MSSLYNYFSDLTELILAALEPVMATAEVAYVGLLRDYWPDAELSARCTGFIEALYAFWEKHSRLLHLRNNMADAHDRRMMQQRVRSSQSVIRLILTQMDGDPSVVNTPASGMASILMTGIERSITVHTDDYVKNLFGEDMHRSQGHGRWPAARLMELTIRDGRALMCEFETGKRSAQFARTARGSD